MPALWKRSITMIQKDIQVYYLSLHEETPNRDYWDYGFVDDLLKQFAAFEVSALQHSDFAIVVIPARHHAQDVAQINKELKKVKGVILFLMGDEESDFPVEKIKHLNIKIWVQNPKPGRHDRYEKLGTGYPPQIHNISEDAPDKTLDYFFAGQVTHARRKQCVAQLENIPSGDMLATPGFTQGLEQGEYYEKLSRAKTAPCPSGPITVDTFRLFESLQLGCVPIADTETPTEDWAGFWEWLFDGPVPFPTIKNWDSLTGYITEITAEYPAINNRVQVWWMRYKNEKRQVLYDQITQMGKMIEASNITVIIPVSPIPSHPCIDILVETIQTVQFHHPNVQILLTFDGVRKEQEDKRADYEEHIRRVLWRYRDNINIVPYVFDKHLHQVGMAREIIDSIKTPLLLYVEQDTPIVIEEPIGWVEIEDLILSGKSNHVRLHHEAGIHPEHRHLMVDSDPLYKFLRTVQYSQRPHVASTAFYRRILSEQFSKNANCFIEDLVHGRVLDDWIKDKEQGWQQWRLHIYHPNEKDIKRSYHTDGRAGGAKYDKLQKF